MDKKSIIGIAVVAVLFLGFAYFNSQQQKEYLEQKAAYEAYVDSVAAAARAAAPWPIRWRRVTACRQKWRPQRLRQRYASVRWRRWASR